MKRGQEIEATVTKTCVNLGNQMWLSRKAVRKSLRDASQDFEPLFQWYESQLPIKIRKSFTINYAKHLRK